MCIPTTVQPGTRVSAPEVTVSVYNASTRVGLAERTMSAFEDQGFGAGKVGNAPKGTSVLYAQVWTDDPKNPAVQLVLSRLGPRAHILVKHHARARRHGGGRAPQFDKLVHGQVVGQGHRNRDDLLAATSLYGAPTCGRASARGGRARRPCAAAGRSRSRCPRGVTTSTSSPRRRTVRRSGTIARPSRTTIDTDDPAGSRSSPTSTPWSSDTGLTVTCSMSAATRSSGATSKSSCRGSERRVTRSRLATTGSVGPVSSVEITTITKTMSKSRFGVVDALGQRDRGQHDRHGAPQPGPGHERELAHRHRLHDRARPAP